MVTVSRHNGNARCAWRDDAKVELPAELPIFAVGRLCNKFEMIVIVSGLEDEAQIIGNERVRFGTD
jgi:hypothetical protein